MTKTLLPFQKIAVVGLGLIGGSLVKRLRHLKPDCKLIGVDFRSVISAARDYLDESYAPEDLAHALRGADLVFLATPINVILDLLPDVAHSVKPGAIVTDVGSTKNFIAAQAQKYFTGERYFIGGHPMAGREKGGWENSHAHLFENAAYVLTPLPNFPAHLLESLKNFLQTAGARVITLEPASHDRIVADISHLPQLLAVTLMNFIARENAPSELCLQLAGGGFRDMTRLAASPFGIWQDILASNHANIRQSLREFIDVLQGLAHDFDNKNLEANLRQANQLRELMVLPQ